MAVPRIRRIMRRIVDSVRIRIFMIAF